MRRRYDKQGILALYPQAFFDLFVEVDQPTNETIESCEIVAIRGPLEHHDDWWCDSYEAILDRVTAACESTSSTVVLRIDSPGGELFGCFDAARTIRARVKAAGKKLVAYVDGCACSAGYALACAAEQIYTSETAFTGSIGILITRVDLTARDAQMGARFALVASGKRKIDGHPHSSLNDAELTAMQSQCDSLAELFFELVASLRGVSADAIRSLEAGVFHGAAAVSAGLADRVASFDEMLAQLANGGNMPPEDDKKPDDKKDEEKEPEASTADVDEARTALERAAADGDERAQRALDVLNGDEGGESESEGDEASSSASSSRRAPAARVPSSRVSAEGAAGLAGIVARLERQVGEIASERDGAKRSALLAGRPDLGKELAAHLATMPYKDAKAIVDRMPVPDAPPKKSPAATAVVSPSVRGSTEGQGGSSGVEASPATEALDRAFGIAGPKQGVKREGNALVFNAPAARELKRPATTTTPATSAAPGAAKG